MPRYRSHLDKETLSLKNKGKDADELVFKCHCLWTPRATYQYEWRHLVALRPAGVSREAREGNSFLALACHPFICTCFIQVLSYFNDHFHHFSKHSEWNWTNYFNKRQYQNGCHSTMQPTYSIEKSDRTALHEVIYCLKCNCMRHWTKCAAVSVKSNQ